MDGAGAAQLRPSILLTCSASAVPMNWASAPTCRRTASRPAEAGTAARLSLHVSWYVIAALSHVRVPSASDADPASASRSWWRVMSSRSTQSRMPDGGSAGVDAERLRASARAAVARAIANCTDAANGFPADRASADDRAVSQALGYGVDWQINVTLCLVCGAAAEVAILETAPTTMPVDVASFSPFVVEVAAATAARASTMAMAQDHAATGSSLLLPCHSRELALANVSMVPAR